jgi:hypothetical protein
MEKAEGPDDDLGEFMMGEEQDIGQFNEEASDGEEGYCASEVPEEECERNTLPSTCSFADEPVPQKGLFSSLSQKTMQPKPNQTTSAVWLYLDHV